MRVAEGDQVAKLQSVFEKKMQFAPSFLRRTCEGFTVANEEDDSGDPSWIELAGVKEGSIEI